MVWAGFGYAGKSPLCFIPTRTNAEIYIELLETVLTEFAVYLYGDEWIFQQDNVPIHTARKTKDFLAARKIPLLQWPAISPDLNPIEDLWGILSNKVYKNGQFDTVNDLKKALIKEWDQINPTTLQDLATSTPNRINQIFIKKGKYINYKEVYLKLIKNCSTCISNFLAVCTYKGGQKYFHKKKVKYIHNLNLHLVNFGLNGKVI